LKDVRLTRDESSVWYDCRMQVVQEQIDNEWIQELSYRKEIARQLRTQYAEGIYDNPLTLKSRLRVTQRNHW